MRSSGGGSACIRSTRSRCRPAADRTNDHGGPISAQTLRIAWFSTGRGPGSFSALSRTLDAIEAGKVPARIELLFCNREHGEAEPTDRFLDHARQRGVPVVALSSVQFRKRVGGERSREGEPLPEWRHDYDAAVARALEPYHFDLGVLFGYMLITTPPLCGRFTLINEHPALPWGPTGTWQEVIRQLIAGGATESGVMIHSATQALDRGPVLTYARYGLEDLLPFESSGHADDEQSPLFQEIRRRGLLREVPLLHETLTLIAAEGLPREPKDLTEAVERAITSGQ